MQAGERIYNIRTRDYELVVTEVLDHPDGPQWHLTLWSRKSIVLPAYFGDSDESPRYETQPVPCISDTVRTSHMRELVAYIEDIASFVERRQREVKAGLLRHLMAPVKKTRLIKRGKRKL